MDNIYNYFKSLSESQMGFWGSVVGAIIGVIGAFLVGVVAIALERLNGKKRQRQTLIRSHGDRILEVEIFVILYIQTQLKNERLLKQCAELTTLGHFMITLPRVMTSTLSHQGHIINQQLLNEVVSFEMSVNLHNQVIEDFDDSYKEFRALLMPFALENNLQELDQDTITHQHKTLLNFARSAALSTQNAYENGISLLALITLRGESAQKKKPKKIKTLSNHIFSDEKIELKAVELRAIYNQKEMFKTV